MVVYVREKSSNSDGHFIFMIEVDLQERAAVTEIIN